MVRSKINCKTFSILLENVIFHHLQYCFTLFPLVSVFAAAAAVVQYLLKIAVGIWKIGSIYEKYSTFGSCLTTHISMEIKIKDGENKSIFRCCCHCNRNKQTAWCKALHAVLLFAILIKHFQHFMLQSHRLLSVRILIEKNGYGRFD